MSLRIVLIQSISNFDYCLLTTYRLKIICLIISQGYLRKYGRFINNSQNKKEEKYICRQLFSYFFCSARVKWGTCYSFRSMAFCSKYHWLRKKTIIYSLKCNQPIFSKFSEHLARLYVRERSDECTEHSEGTWNPLSCPTPPCFLFFLCFQTGKWSGKPGVNWCCSEEAKVESVRLCSLCQSTSTAHSNGAIYVGWDMQSMHTLSLILPLYKKTPDQTNKEKENQHREIHFTVKQRGKARSHSKNFLSACKVTTECPLMRPFSGHLPQMLTQK